MAARAVIGASFGDEGKGLMVDYLASAGDVGVVVRFNGGAQAGHTVVTPDGRRHVFKTVGSGAFAGVPTFLSQFVTVNPVALFLELQALDSLGVVPEVYASPDCLITTFADMIINRRLEEKRGTARHGSCGMGVGETAERSRVDELRITLSDIYNGGAGLETKMDEICDRYARFRTGEPIDEPRMIERFLKACKALPEAVFPAGIGQCKNPLFEGAQGLCLDMDNKAMFPHVSRGKTGLHNVRLLCAQAGIALDEAYYVSRTYVTRHGAGPLPGEDPKLSFEDETNEGNDWQGTMRFAPLDPRSLVERIYQDAGSTPVRVVLTHRDQLPRRDLDGTVQYSSYGPTREDVVDHGVTGAVSAM